MPRRRAIRPPSPTTSAAQSAKSDNVGSPGRYQGACFCVCRKGTMQPRIGKDFTDKAWGRKSQATAEHAEHADRTKGWVTGVDFQRRFHYGKFGCFAGSSRFSA